MSHHRGSSESENNRCRDQVFLGKARSRDAARYHSRTIPRFARLARGTLRVQGTRDADEVRVTAVVPVDPAGGSQVEVRFNGFRSASPPATFAALFSPADNDRLLGGGGSDRLIGCAGQDEARKSDEDVARGVESIIAQPNGPSPLAHSPEYRGEGTRELSSDLHAVVGEAAK